MIATGLERLANGDDEARRQVRGVRVGLVAHPASVTSRLVHAHRVLDEAGAQVEALFGPEHGYGGEAQDMIGVEAVKGALPIYSLYGDDPACLSPTAEQLAGLDALVIDLQDVGSRYYTFVWTAVLCMVAAAKNGVKTIVLDRPNPLGGEVVEGAPQREGYLSFVGLRPVAVRHGLTIGEIVKRAQREMGIAQDALHVVTMRGWKRSMWFDETGLPWVLPSPNMPTLDTATVYPGGCLVEGTNLSEGRGTTKPFEIVGAPFVDGHAVARSLVIEGATLRPLSFHPMFQKHARTQCGGVQVHVTDRARFRSYAAYLRLIAAMRGPEFRFRTERYEYVTDRPALDLLTGGPEMRAALDHGDVESALGEEESGVARFLADARRDWLY